MIRSRALLRRVVAPSSSPHHQRRCGEQLGLRGGHRSLAGAAPPVRAAVLVGSASVLLAPPFLAPASSASFHTTSRTLLDGNTSFPPHSSMDASSGPRGSDVPFAKLLAANRGEISTRITRAAAELGIRTAGIYSHEGTSERTKSDEMHRRSWRLMAQEAVADRGRVLIAPKESKIGRFALLFFRSHFTVLPPCFPPFPLSSDRFTQHRYKCDQAFELDSNKSPVAQYLDIAKIVDICVKNRVEAVHPGYGFLSENEGFARALEDAGIAFVGPTVRNLQVFGDKTAARHVAIANRVPVVAGSKDAFATSSDARKWILDSTNNCPYPVIVKGTVRFYFRSRVG